MRAHLAHPDDPRIAACGCRPKPGRRAGGDCKRCPPARRRLDAVRAARLAEAAGKPLLVLDFDGVFNHIAFAKERARQRKILGDLADVFDVECVRRASRVAQQAGAVAVISSSWRSAYSLNGLDVLLGGNGFDAPIIGATPEIPGGWDRGTRQDRESCAAEHFRCLWTRGLEIGAFLDELPGCPAGLAIIDDDPIGGDLETFQIRTSFEAGGLTDELADAALKMLLQPPRPIPWRRQKDGGSAQ